MIQKPPYSIEIYATNLHIRFRSNVSADLFFEYASELQYIFETRTYGQKRLNSIYIDFSDTIWFDTLAMCYLLMFADQSNRLGLENIHFTFPEDRDIENLQHSLKDYLFFHAFLQDNGFLTQMRNIGFVDNLDTVSEIQYSKIHNCVWPLQIFHKKNDIENSIELIKKQLHNELSNELNPYELDYLIEKVTYFLQETLDNAYKHGYGNSRKDNPCALLIKRVRCTNAIDISSYCNTTIKHAPYLNVSLFEEMHEYLEVYVADVGVGLRHSFLEDPNGKDSEITDENILDYILTEGKRSRKKMSTISSSRYGGLYDITAMFKGDGDKLGFKADSRWFFDQKSERINSQIQQHDYDGLVHGFAIVGNISWKKRHSGDYPFITEIQQITQKYKNKLFAENNPWMVANYRKYIFIWDSRFSEDASVSADSPIAVLFPSKYLVKERIIDKLTLSNSHTVIIAGIHESEYKKYRTMLESLHTNTINPQLRRAIIITNTLFAHVFITSNDQLIYSKTETKKYIEASFTSPDENSIANSYISFRFWKRVYDSEQLWNCLSQKNNMAYINTQVQWKSKSLRGYLDFSQLNLIPECRSLCIEQLIGFLLHHDRLYFRSLDRFTDEICEQANHLMDNSRSGKTYWIGSIFVSGSSERKLYNENRDEENVFYFFKHADCETTDKKVYSMFEWTTQPMRINKWFDPTKYQDKEYSRVGNTSFVAEGGSNYWASRHYKGWDRAYKIRQEDTYQLLQRRFGAHPAILKMGHFDSVDHHDLFEIKSDSLVSTDVIAHQILQNQENNSYEYLITEFLQALISSPPKKKYMLKEYFSSQTSDHTISTVIGNLPPSRVRKASEKYGLIVYLNDYQTSKIIETIKPVFSNQLQQRIIPIIPIEKNYASSTLLISPLLLDLLEQKMIQIRHSNQQETGTDAVKVTLFIATSFTTRLQEELKHIIMRMGATQVRILSLFDRQRMPYGRSFNEGISAYGRLDLPAIGFSDTCPICTALDSLNNLRKSLRDPALRKRVDEISVHWEAVKSSDNHHGNGITIRHIDIPDDIQLALYKYCSVYDQGNIEISTDLGLSLFAIENTVISLSLDFLNTCIESEKLDQSTKLLLLSAHFLTFNHLQITEKYYCELIQNLCNILREQKDVSPYTELAVVALCGQASIFHRFTQEFLIDCAKKDQHYKNNDALLFYLAMYQSTRYQKDLIIPQYYRTDLHCFLSNEQNAVELIYDVFLYSELDYRQSHRQAFGLIKGTSIKLDAEVYTQALTYTQKLKKIYELDHLKKHFHNTAKYDENKSHIISCLQTLENSLGCVNSNEDHKRIKTEMLHVLEDKLQDLHKGLYLRASDSESIHDWLSYCETIAQHRFNQTSDKILRIILGYSIDANSDSDVTPWFFAHADVTEEVINLIVDMLKRRAYKLNNFLQPNDCRSDQCYDGIITVRFFKEYVELSFYNATDNPLSIYDIRNIKRSKFNRPSMIAFQHFEDMLKRMTSNQITDCFECNYVENTYPNCLAHGLSLMEGEHLYCATMRIPYIDMGSSFGCK